MFQSATVTLSVSTLAAIALPLVLLLVLMVCLSCFKRKTTGGFSNFSNSAETTNANNAHVNNSFTVDIEDTDVDQGNSSAISLEPLPDIASKLKLPICPLRPRIGCMEKVQSDASLKLIVAHQPFPRSQITYLKELGCGWFGKVIESDAENITTGVARSKVVVKMLKDDANKDEQQLFLEEMSAFRELEHPNMMRLLGQCTEINPTLVILEYAALGNLKQYLRNHRHEQATLVQKNRLIQFALDTSKGLACLHGHNYLHKDLAARNCLVMSDHTLKIGDYGIAEDLFKEDYLTAGSDLLPIRWMAPETLKLEKGTWTSAQFSKESDIWSLGVVLWEIAMLGERPYDMLTDEAVLQGVITDKDIRLPEPDIGMPSKDRLYEVMRFCWMDPSDRLKVDEVYKLLEQIASRTPEEGSPGDTITTFEQKWEHLMPNQRHESVDSIEDQQGSISSDDSNLLDESLSDPNSLEDLTAAGAKTAAPSAPPRASRRKLSVRAVTIPKVDDVSEEAPAADKKQKVPGTEMKQVKEPSAVPQINIIDEAGRQAEQEKSETPRESKEPSSSEMEFTEFTSHSTDEEGSEETPNVSQIEPGTFAPDETPSEKTASEMGDALSKVRETVEDDSLTFSTPYQAQTKARKTSTPVAKDEPSPSSSSSLSGGDSSATFMTAGSSSPSNLTDAYATASDSTLVTGRSKTDLAVAPEVSGEIVEDSSMSFEILETTAVPSVLADSTSKSGDVSETEVSDPFSPAKKDPFTDEGNSVAKDDGFGEFTNGSLVEENSSTSPKDSVAPSSSTDASTSHNEFFSMVSESPEVISKSQTEEAFTASASEPAQETNPFVSFGTDLPSLGSPDVPKVAQNTDQDQVFPSFSSEVSSLNSLNTDSTLAQQAEPQNDIFAFDTASPPQESQKSVSGLDLFSSDIISALPGTEEFSTHSDKGKDSGQPVQDLSANLSSIPPDSSSTFMSDSGNHSETQPPASDPFGLGDPALGMQESSFEIIQAQDSNKTSMSSSAFSDFDILSSFSAHAASTSPSNPFTGGEDVPASVQKESQDGVLVAGDPAEPPKSSEASLLDFSAFESAAAGDSKQEEGSAEKTTPEAKTSSLIDF